MKHKKKEVMLCIHWKLSSNLEGSPMNQSQPHIVHCCFPPIVRTSTGEDAMKSEAKE